MKSAYAICVLLCITIDSLVLANGGIAQTTNETQASNKSIPLPNSTAKIDETQNSTTAEPNTTQSTTNSTITTTTPTSTTTANTSTSTTTTTTTTTTTPVPTTPPNITTTTVSPPITTTNATTSSTTVSTSTTAAKTTAIPTGAPPPSKDRHFDGLSFFGGIILATCLMAIAAFSWKFYRQCNERNYRTL
ncbi:unnamed protein product [Lasius platythorax]|uniref:Sialomucin core protein 24 n=1 Tax=Lasius platythorax TaxID=488582 RepID=A0AAV2MZZ3_9HYME